MHESDASDDGAGWYRRVRRADVPVAALAGVGDVLLCGALFMMTVASGITFGAPDATQQAEMDAAYQLTGRIWLGWLVGGLVLFAGFRLLRSALTHAVCMIVPPAALLVCLAAAG